MGKLRTMSGNGDDTVATWDPADTAEMEAAQLAFEQATKPNEYGYRPMAYTVNADDPTKAEQVREFDPDAYEIVVHAPMQGG